MTTAERQVPAAAGRGSSREVDYTRPLLLGYILKHLLMTDGELADTKVQLEEFAEVEGFAMGTIYTEETATTPAAFEALIEAVNRYEVTTVVIPGQLHFSALAITHNVKDTFERATGARVVIASSLP
ncbi:hypothetical protein GCM10029976_047660 [Kribbella albertanoniae]|uniref:Uncharacterized protein n=1 Tax=Kribbella albertanoniae TaxID=1266829 RepID=A0A4R4Q4D4_9ACTN|nr:hypothetical protein [Kribbella albertanoniae]TDC29732.1 hypothetical protein E1261_15045 [Kribbella albertanoniae]